MYSCSSTHSSNCLSPPSDFYQLTFSTDDFENDILSHSRCKSTDDSNSRKETISDIHQQLNQLASENLNLQDKINRQSDELSEAKAQLRKFVGQIIFQLEWSISNSEKQNNHRMQTFDLSPLRDQLRARVEEAFQNLLKRSIEPVLSPKIVPAILQHESNQRMLDGVDEENNERRQSTKEQSSQRALDDLILNFIHNKLKVYGADSVLLEQVFGQMTYWICALALNHLMFRKELCNFEKAIQIKHNVTEVQSWLSTNGLSVYRETLEPLVQASHLLQSKKDESNLDILCGEMTSKLKPKQVVAILQHYTPIESFEERRLSPDFLFKVCERLNARTRTNGGTNADINMLIMMGTYLTPFNSEPFVYSDFNLEALSLPACLHLQAVCKLM